MKTSSILGLLIAVGVAIKDAIENSDSDNN
jgi:hypothetical protein